MEEEILATELERHIKKGKYIKKKDLLAIPAIASNPVTKLILNSYTSNNKIDFPLMIKDLQMFVGTSSVDDKLNFLFKLYDSDNDGQISNHELYNILNILCEEKLEDHKVQNVVDQTFRLAETDKIGLNVFKKLIISRTKNIETYFKASN